MSCPSLYRNYKITCNDAEIPPNCEDTVDEETLRYDRCAKKREFFKNKCVPENKRDEGHEFAIKSAKEKSNMCISKFSKLKSKSIQNIDIKPLVKEEMKSLIRKQPKKKEPKAPIIQPDTVSDEELEFQLKEDEKKRQMYLDIVSIKIEEIYPNIHYRDNYLVLQKIILDKFKTEQLSVEDLREISEIKDISNLILEDPIIDLDFESKSPLIVIYLFERNPSTRMFVPASFRVGDVLDRLLHLHLLKKGFKPKDYTACEKDLSLLNLNKNVVSEIGIGNIFYLTNDRLILNSKLNQKEAFFLQTDFLSKIGVESVSDDYDEMITNLVKRIKEMRNAYSKEEIIYLLKDNIKKGYLSFLEDLINNSKTRIFKNILMAKKEELEAETSRLKGNLDILLRG